MIPPLNEADIFLEQHSLDDLQRNALISVFLRVLKYNDGILVLTSNWLGILEMLSGLRSIRFVLQVGIGGVPSKKADIANIWLGDVAASTNKQFRGVVQYDFGKAIRGQQQDRQVFPVRVGSENTCNPRKLVARSAQATDDLLVHYGLIASDNARDGLARRLDTRA
jgi:hypothetical protein